MAWFGHMVEHCLDTARQASAAGQPIVGIMCEYTPREIIMAGGGVPVCLCGGSARMAAAAEGILPPALCPVIKATFGYHLQKANPFLEMADLIVAETTCDGKKKMFELLAGDRAVRVLELPQKAGDADALFHWRRELEKLIEFLEARWRVSITADALRAAIRAMNRDRDLRRRLAGLMRQADPPLTGRQLLELKSLIACQPDDWQVYAQVLAAGAAGTDEVAAPGRRVRVLLTGVPLPHGAERVMDLVEAQDALVVAQENCTGLKPLEEDIDPEAQDLLGAIAEKYFHLPCSVMTRNDRRLENLARLAQDYRVECIVELVWQGCHTYAVEARQVQALADHLKLPYLRIETDYAPADSARIVTRLEALFETVRARRPK